MYGCHYVACAGVLLWNEDLRVAAKPERKRRWKGRSSLQPAVQRSGSADHGSERPVLGRCAGDLVRPPGVHVRPFRGLWLVAALLAPAASQAQVSTNITPSPQPGASLGTIVTPQVGGVYDITGGTRSGNGQNLFHSFGTLM